jgi:4a-hydroxytetrahydrobiopterin dehydratase
MTELKKLSSLEVEQRLKTLQGWSLNEGKLYKEYKFKNFVAAFAYMTKVAEVAEKMGHHPEWFNVYDTVRVHLATHEVEGVSQYDFDLANQMENLHKN